MEHWLDVGLRCAVAHEFAVAAWSVDDFVAKDADLALRRRLIDGRLDEGVCVGGGRCGLGRWSGSGAFGLDRCIGSGGLGFGWCDGIGESSFGLGGLKALEELRMWCVRGGGCAAARSRGNWLANLLRALRLARGLAVWLLAMV